MGDGFLRGGFRQRRSLAAAVMLAVLDLGLAPATAAEFKNIPCPQNRLQFDASGLQVRTTTCKAIRQGSGSAGGGDVNWDNDYLFADSDQGFVNVNYLVAGTRTHMKHIDDVKSSLRSSYPTHFAKATEWSEMKKAQSRIGGIRYHTYKNDSRDCLGFLGHYGSKGESYEATARGYVCGTSGRRTTEDELFALLGRVRAVTSR